MSVSAPQVGPHGLDPVLAAAMHGTGPPADFETSLLPRPPGPVSAVLAFTGHHAVAPLARARGLGRALAAAARRFVPPDQPVYAQVSPRNVASVRAVLGAGYAPIGAEVLYHHSRHRACSEQSHLPRAVM